MGAESLVNRMLCAEGSIEASHLRTGQLSEERVAQFDRGHGKFVEC